MSDFSVIDIEPSWVLDDEPMGTKEKAWVEMPGDPQPWLFKFSRINEGIATGEHWAEKVAAEIAALLGIPHADVELARFEGRLGSLTRKFDALSDPGVELVHGNELLEGVVEGYDRYKFRGQHDHTLQHILAVVDRIIGTEPRRRETAFRTIGGFILLDALVLNTDRHHENWAMLRQTVDGGQAHHWIAPSFDHASSLGRELTENRLKEWAHEPWRVEWYAKRTRSGVYLKTEGRHGENPLHLAEVAHRR
ncbi:MULTISPECIES: HipA domain-containing protein [Halomonas]|uniref:HipA-like C-terminal domain-containing protein n=1 Tax=Halomonas ventosae TaxID=229007 RepID=A0A4R6I7A6_9GAMM|nr:HipA domain-containing protein [Halomonas ventosae]TDO16645.1 hypothetical protein DFO68_101174 [Halomonas ventosae]